METASLRLSKIKLFPCALIFISYSHLGPYQINYSLFPLNLIFFFPSAFKHNRGSSILKKNKQKKTNSMSLRLLSSLFFRAKLLIWLSTPHFVHVTFSSRLLSLSNCNLIFTSNVFTKSPMTPLLLNPMHTFYFYLSRPPWVAFSITHCFLSESTVLSFFYFLGPP